MSERLAGKQDRAIFVLAVVMLLAILVFQIYITQLPLEQLLEHVVNDDTFYYLEVAYRAARGEGFTFDGINRTNGFQPAWEFILTGLAFLFRSKEGLLRSALVLCAVLNFATGLVIYGILGPILRSFFALIPLVVWASVQCTPFLSLSGMETSLNWFVFSLTLWYIVALAKQEAKSRSVFMKRRLLGVFTGGVLCGLLFLSRIDNAVYVACALVLMSEFLASIQQGSFREKLWARARVGFGISVVAGLLVVPYLVWNITRFGTLMPVSGLIKQKKNFILVTSQMGGYLTAETFAYSMRRVLEKLLWVFATGLKTIGFGQQFWLASPLLFIALSFSICLSFVCGYYVRVRFFSTSGGGSKRPAVRSVFGSSLLALVPFWVGYGMINLVFEADAFRGVAKTILVIAGLLGAGVAGARQERQNHSRIVDVGVAKTIMFFSTAVPVHAMIIVYTVDHFLDYTSWYFANWFVVVSLVIGIAVALFDHNVLTFSAQRLSRVLVFTWFLMGILLTGYFTLGVVMAQLGELPYGINGQYGNAKWLEANTPPSAIIAAYNAGVIGYFSNRATVNLDGLINNRDIMPYLFGPRTMTEYIDLICPDYYADGFHGTYQDGEISASGDTIRKIDRTRLIPIRWISGRGWLDEPQTYIIFRVVKADSCSQE